MIDIEELEFEFNSFFGDKENEHTLLARMFPLIAEVKRLQKDNNRYLDFILWLGLEHKGKKLALEYGDEQLAEMIE
tara:strand:- start:359 stop:586 length:228 start_codon:yes stop_codon:yes gene_type:complete